MSLFYVGQTVLVGASGAMGAPSGRYKIISAMPLTHGIVRYRVKGELERFERVIEEGLMRAQEL